MKEPILHTRSKSGLLNYLNRPTHGLILSGPEGAGKYFIAKWLADMLNAPLFTIEAPVDKSVITIEQIRELYNITRTGTNLIVIIKDAHKLGREAQNAFLKLLEEPPKNTKFVLTSSKPNVLLPTIHSRAQLIEILEPSKVVLSAEASSATNLTELELKSLLHTAQYLPGKVFELLNDDNAFELHQASVTEAKTFYSSSSYERNLVCIEHKFEKQWSQTILELLAVIIRSLIKQNAGNTTMLKKLKNQAELLEVTANNLLSINGSAKIHLTKLCQQF